MTIALITGGGNGLGRATCARLTADGHRVAALDIDGDGLAGLGDDHAALTIQADLTDHEAVDRAIETVHDRLGAVGILVNNAGIYPSAPFIEVTADVLDRVLDVNVRSAYHLTQMVIQDMAALGSGAVVNLSSITISGGWDLLSSYVTSKAALIGMTRALARELGPSGIRVNAVAPGAFPTAAEAIHPDPEAYTARILEGQALKRRGTPEELAGVISFLVGPDSSFITGQTIAVDGGWVML
jgi:NAD(P)-dependent dehydrogenase (short-subunit alcohol dehydrogenase family)